MIYNKLYISFDTSSISVGSDKVFQSCKDEILNKNLNIEIIKTGSRGLFWLEPIIEFETEEGRIGFGPVQPSDVKDIFQKGKEHQLYLGLIEAIPFLKKQERLTFNRCGIIDPLSLKSYCEYDGLNALNIAKNMNPENIIEYVKDSGLRGRGGAGFPTGIKWETVLKTPAEKKYIVCNADEGDSGTFADRMLMEGDPFLIIEGMVIAGFATMSEKGFIYIRSEYPRAISIMSEAIKLARENNILGKNILNSNQSFDLEIRVGAGSYICGEETSLLESLEGKRGQVRVKPPLPAISGLFGFPTLVNNVLSFAAVPTILSKGPKYYFNFGKDKSRGTMPIQLSGNILRGGLIEVPFGLSLRNIIEDFGGGSSTKKEIKAVQVGGPLGAYWPKKLMDTIYDYESIDQKGGILGHGGIVIFDENTLISKQAKFAFEFCSIESCGKCTPCRIGSTRGVETMEKIINLENVETNISIIKDLCEVMQQGSLCALGGLTPLPVLSAFKYFPEEFSCP